MLWMLLILSSVLLSTRVEQNVETLARQPFSRAAGPTWRRPTLPGVASLVVGGLGCVVPAAPPGCRSSIWRAVASGERDGVDDQLVALCRRNRPLPLRAHSRPRRRCPFFLKRVRRFRSRGTRGRRPVGGKARVQVTLKMIKVQERWTRAIGCRLGAINSISAVNVMKTETV